MPIYADEEIRRRIELSHKILHQIEGNLADFLNYIPLDYDHLEIYSLKLVAIILEMGPELLNSFELAVSETNVGMGEWFGSEVRRDRDDLWNKEKKRRDNKSSLTFYDYYHFLNEHGSPRLSAAGVQLRDLDAYILPFEEEKPQWWETYNLLKHDKYNHLKAANLGTTLKAIGALYWLVDNNSKMFHLVKPFLSEIFITTEVSRLVTSSLRKL